MSELTADQLKLRLREADKHRVALSALCTWLADVYPFDDLLDECPSGLRPLLQRVLTDSPEWTQ